MDSKFNEVLEAVRKLNEEIMEDNEGGTEYCCFWVLETNGIDIIINFLGQGMWRSDEDERDFDESKNEYEPLEPFLRRESKKISQIAARH